MLGYSGKWHHYSIEDSLWCIECTFTMPWQQYLLTASCSLFKTLTSNYIKYTSSHGYFLQQTVFGSNWALCTLALMAHHSGVGCSGLVSSSNGSLDWVLHALASIPHHFPEWLWCFVLLARYTHILCTLMVHWIGYSAMTSMPYHFLVSQQYGIWTHRYTLSIVGGKNICLAAR